MDFGSWAVPTAMTVINVLTSWFTHGLGPAVSPAVPTPRTIARSGRVASTELTRRVVPALGAGHSGTVRCRVRGTDTGNYPSIG